MEKLYTTKKTQRLVGRLQKGIKSIRGHSNSLKVIELFLY